MALNGDYFDNIHIDVVKKKYYNANKVEAVLEDIRLQATALTEENARMRAQLEALHSKKVEIGDAVLSAQSIACAIIEKAKANADALMAETMRKSEELSRERARQQDYAVEKVEACLAHVKDLQLRCVEALNSEWQDFLCGLYTEDNAVQSADIPASTPQTEPDALSEAVSEEQDEEDETPAEIDQEELEAKVNAIAKELFAIDEKN